MNVSALAVLVMCWPQPPAPQRVVVGLAALINTDEEAMAAVACNVT
jgi:hypothetical protein